MAPGRNLLPFHKKEASNPQETHSNGQPNGFINQTNRTKSNLYEDYTAHRWRNEAVAAAAEFAGTFMFLFFAFGGTQVANTAASADNAATAGQKGNSITQAPNTSVLLYISLIFGFSLMVNVWVFFRVSGGLFNPAVSTMNPLFYVVVTRPSR
jgi:aquaporin related protein